MKKITLGLSAFCLLFVALSCKTETGVNPPDGGGPKYFAHWVWTSSFGGDRADVHTPDNTGTTQELFFDNRRLDFFNASKASYYLNGKLKWTGPVHFTPMEWSNLVQDSVRTYTFDNFPVTLVDSGFTPPWLLPGSDMIFQDSLGNFTLGTSVVDGFEHHYDMKKEPAMIAY